MNARENHWTEFIVCLCILNLKNLDKLKNVSFDEFKYEVQKEKRIICNNLEPYILNLYNYIYPINNKQQCCAKTKKGIRCKHKCKSDSDFCKQHNKKKVSKEFVNNKDNKNEFSEKNYKNILSYKENINKFKKEILKKKRIKKIFLCGKSDNIKDPDFNIIKEENKKLKDENKTDSKKICKSDIYILFHSNLHIQFIGLSIKKDSNCTKMNYSIHSILGKIVNNELEIELNKIKAEILNNEGITKDNFKNKKKGKRIYNKSFYNKKDNLYWNKLNKYISENKEGVIKTLYSNYACINNYKYEVYELCNEKYTLLNNNNYYELKNLDLIYDKDTSERKITASKLFYDLKYKNRVWMKLEIRFKGNPFVSPQFQTAKCYDLELI